MQGISNSRLDQDIFIFFFFFLQNSYVFSDQLLITEKIPKAFVSLSGMSFLVTAHCSAVIDHTNASLPVIFSEAEVTPFTVQSKMLPMFISGQKWTNAQLRGCILSLPYDYFFLLLQMYLVLQLGFRNKQ